MFPETTRFTIGGREWEIGFYSACIFFAGATVLLGGLWSARGLSRRRTALVLLAAWPAALLGARVLNLLLNGTEPFSWERLCDLRCANFSLYGGLFAGGATAAVGARVAKLPLARLADAMAIPLAAAIGIARLGCFCRGCCFGLACDQPWGVVYPYRSPAHLLQMVEQPLSLLTGPAPVHPTQLYEVGAAACAAFVAVACRRRAAPPGVGFLAAAICFTSLRWLNLLFRAPVYATASLGPVYPLLYSATLLASVLALYALLRASCSNSPDLPSAS